MVTSGEKPRSQFFWKNTQRDARQVEVTPKALYMQSPSTEGQRPEVDLPGSQKPKPVGTLQYQRH